MGVRSYVTQGGDPFAEAPQDLGQFGLILIDQPLGAGGEGGTSDDKFRPVERRWTNKFVETWQNDAKVQWPRFQAGKKYQDDGLVRANRAIELFGEARVVVVESFPQLVVPYLMTRPATSDVKAVVRLAAHKTGPDAAKARKQLAAQFTTVTGLAVDADATMWDKAGAADAMDAVLGLLPGIWWYQGKDCVRHFHAGGGDVTKETLTRDAATAPAQWKDVKPGVHTDGILGLAWWVPGKPV